MSKLSPDSRSVLNRAQAKAGLGTKASTLSPISTASTASTTKPAAAKPATGAPGVPYPAAKPRALGPATVTPGKGVNTTTGAPTY